MKGTSIIAQISMSLTSVLHRERKVTSMIFQIASFSTFDDPSFFVHSRYTSLRAYQN